MATFMFSVRKFRKSAAEWLTDEDAPAVVALENIAKELDGGQFSPALVAQFGLVFRNLQKRKPTGEPERDELEAALAEADDDL